MLLNISKNISLPSPAVADLPSECPRRLIDNVFFHYQASVAGFAERYGHGETSHTIHVWWARRPHASMRALVFASLCKDSGVQAEKILSKIGLSASIDDIIINQARKFLSIQYDDKPPKVLDMFGGGGTIPLEALNLGAETYAIDANELSVFIQKCNLVYSQSQKKEKIQLILKKSGEKILNQLKKETVPLYPLRHSESPFGGRQAIIGYLWTYSRKCENCDYKYFVMKRPWLSKKKGRNIAFIINNNDKAQTISIKTVPKKYKFQNVWVGRKGTTQCPKCNHSNQKADIKNCQDELIAMIRPAKGSGKEFLSLRDDALPDEELIHEIESDALDYLGLNLPDSELPVWSGIVNPALYGIKTHSDFFNSRQRAVLVLLIKCLYDEFNRLLKTETEEIAIYIISLLSGLIDQIVDWNSRLSMWIPQNEQVGRGFCGPGISMIWDYAEIDPLSSGPSNLNDKLKRILKGSASIKVFPNKAFIQHAYAQKLPFKSNYFDAIVTDPPYYDNVYYSVLSDFFFSWKRLVLHSVEPELFKSKTTNCSRELVASTKRNKTPSKAHTVYCEQLKLSISEAARVLKPDGVFSFIYSHSSLNGWEALIKSYRLSDLIITSVQPLSIERKQRPRAINSQAVNTCLCFVARKSHDKKRETIPEDVFRKIKYILSSKYTENLIEWGWSEYDAALAVFAYGVALIANALKVKEADSEMMIKIEKIIKNKISTFKITRRQAI